MGLAISTGALADLTENDPEGAEWLRASFQAVNRILSAKGLPQHVEPDSIEVTEGRASIGSFPYSFVHYLRYAYAQRIANPNWVAKPLPDSIDPSEDPLVLSELDKLRSHLICHSDAEGFYVPVDFEDVLFGDDQQPELPGGMLGSTYRLMEELVAVAPALGIKLEDGQLSDAEAARVDDIASSGEGLCRELCSWLALYEATRQSIQQRTAILFS